MLGEMGQPLSSISPFLCKRDGSLFSPQDGIHREKWTVLACLSILVPSRTRYLFQVPYGTPLSPLFLLASTWLKGF
jgi:hypothetical protein